MLCLLIVYHSKNLNLNQMFRMFVSEYFLLSKKKETEVSLFESPPTRNPQECTREIKRTIVRGKKRNLKRQKSFQSSKNSSSGVRKVCFSRDANACLVNLFLSLSLSLCHSHSFNFVFLSQFDEVEV